MSDQFVNDGNGAYGNSGPVVTPPKLPPAQQTAEPAGRKRRGGCMKRGFMVVGGFICVLVVLGVVVNHFGGDDPLGGEYGQDELPQFNEVWSSGSGETKIVRVPLKGVILLEGGGMFGGGAEQSRFSLACIRRATLDENVQGLLLEIDSPGGGITSSDLIFHAVKEFKRAQPGRKVVVLMGDVAASGGYYVALAADEILAHPTTITGSIGVLMQSVNLHQLAGRLGIEDQTIKSGEYKDLMNPLKPVQEEQKAVLQGIIDRMYERFVSLVAQERGMALDEVKTLADGRVYVAEDAVNFGLVDEIGYYRDALASLDHLLPGNGLKVIRYEAPVSLVEALLGGGGFAKALEGLNAYHGTRLMYLWQP